MPPSRDDEPSHGLTDAEEERAWQAIVAGFDAPAVERAVPPDPPDAGPTRGPAARVGAAAPGRTLPPGSAGRRRRRRTGIGRCRTGSATT